MQEKKVPIASIIIAYLIVYIVWGSTFFFIELALKSFTPFILGAIRFIIAGSILMTYCKLRGYKLFNKSDIRQAVLVGFLLLFIDMASIIWSEQYISSGIVTILSSATAIWFIIFDKPKWKENFSSIPTLIGLACGFIGVIMLFSEQVFISSISEKEKSENLIAMLVLTCGTIAWTLGSLYTKYFQKNTEKKDSLNVLVKTAWQMLTAGLAFTTVAMLNGEYDKFDYTKVHTQDWGALIYLVIMGSILAFTSYIWLLQVRPATEVSTYAYINPIVALTLVYYFTDHEVTILQISGLIVVLLSVLLMNWNLYKNNRTFKAIRYRKKLKKLRNMAPKSSIPRIVEVVDFHAKQKDKKTKKEDTI